MIEATGSLRTELRRMVLGSDGSWMSIRLSRGPGGELRLAGAPDQGDGVILVSFEQLPPLVASPELAEELEGAILHFRGSGDDRYGNSGVVVLQARPGRARAEWSPAETKSAGRAVPQLFMPSLFRRRLPSGSTTQSANP